MKLTIRPFIIRYRIARLVMYSPLGLVVMILLSGCLSQRELAVRECLDSGAETITMSDNDINTNFYPVFGTVGVASTSSKSTSRTYNCKKLLLEEKKLQGL